MKWSLWALAGTGTLLTACNIDMGACQGDGPDRRRGIGGGGPIGPGGGGFGDDPEAEPQDDRDAPPGCRVDGTACEEKCLKAYEEDAAQCGGLTDDAQRGTCNEAAHARYTGCRQGCTAADDDAEGEKCRRECQDAKDERDAICRGLPTRKAREKCWRTSNEKYADCAKKCKAGPQ